MAEVGRRVHRYFQAINVTFVNFSVFRTHYSIADSEIKNHTEIRKVIKMAWRWFGRVRPAEETTVFYSGPEQSRAERLQLPERVWSESLFQIEPQLMSCSL